MEQFESKNFDLDIIADKLETLERKENNGRGISCVKTIIMYLRRNDREKAKAVCLNESDKIENYPEIKALLEQELVKEKF